MEQPDPHCHQEGSGTGVRGGCPCTPHGPYPRGATRPRAPEQVAWPAGPKHSSGPRQGSPGTSASIGASPPQMGPLLRAPLKAEDQPAPQRALMPSPAALHPALTERGGRSVPALDAWKGLCHITSSHLVTHLVKSPQNFHTHTCSKKYQGVI